METFVLCLEILGGFFVLLVLGTGIDLWQRRCARAARTRADAMPSFSRGLIVTLCAGMLAFAVGLGLVMSPSVRDEFSDVACEPGWKLVLVPTTSNRGRAGKSPYCARGTELRPTDDTFLLACGALAASVVVVAGSLLTGVFVVISLARRSARGRP